MVSEVSAAKAGEIVLWETLNADGHLQASQPAESVWLLRLPTGQPNGRWKEVQADASTAVLDDEAANLKKEVPREWLSVANPLDPEKPRSVALFTFTLPEFAEDTLQAAVLTLSGWAEGLGDQPTQAQVFIVEDQDWEAESADWQNVPALLNNVPRGHFIRHRVVDNASGAARVAGQINLSRTEPEKLRLDLTGILREAAGQKITVLIAQEPRWDVHPSEKEAKGDIQPHGIQLAPATAKPPHTPRVQLLLNRP